MASCRIALLLAVTLASPAMAGDEPVLQVVDATPFPNLVYAQMGGKSRLLTQDMGKLTIVHFWATWCEDCLEEYPELDRIQATFADRGLKVVSISMDGIGNGGKVKDFYRKNKISNLPILLDDGTKAFRAAKTRGLPTSFFINRDGLKIAIAEGPLDWQSKEVLGFIELHLRAAQ